MSGESMGTIQPRASAGVLNETATGLGHTGRVKPSPGYREWAPPPVLRDAVACVWSQVAPAAPTRPVLVLPDACSDLVWEAGRGAMVAGPDTSAWQTQPGPGSVTLGVRFSPGAGGPALGTALCEIRDERVDLADIAPALAAGLGADLPPPVALERLLGAAFSLVGDGPPDDAVHAATRFLGDPRTRLTTVVEGSGSASASCDDAATWPWATAPRRSNGSSASGASSPVSGGSLSPDLARLAHESGCADQAHLTRECNQLSGLTPSALAARQRPAG